MFLILSFFTLRKERECYYHCYWDTWCSIPSLSPKFLVHIVPIDIISWFNFIYFISRAVQIDIIEKESFLIVTCIHRQSFHIINLYHLFTFSVIIMYLWSQLILLNFILQNSVVSLWHSSFFVILIIWCIWY